MSKKSKTLAKNSESSVKVYFEEDDWGGNYTTMEVREVKEAPATAKGGYITNYGAAQGNIFTAEFGSEENCCGFPLMCQFYERPAALKHAKVIGERLKEWLGKNAVYMQAYVPSKKGYKATEAILKAAGFEPTVSLASSHGKYHNMRWEWNRVNNLPKGVKNAKVVSTLNA